MWLCDYCDAENKTELVCTSCGKENEPVQTEEIPFLTKLLKRRNEKREEDMCALSIKLKVWGKIIFFTCLVIGAIQFIATSGMTLLMMPSGMPIDEFMRSVTLMQRSLSILHSLITMLTWFGRGIIIMLLADAIAIIVQSSYMYIESKS